jgi:HTH-type transcriptional regulator/antitoxin HigA
MANTPAKYLELIKGFPLRPIKTEADLRKAEGVVEKLVSAGHLSAGEEDYLQILGNLIEEYEAAEYPIEQLPPHEMLKASMEAKGVTQTALSKATGIPISTISDLLSQERDFNVRHIQALCAYFGFGPSAFIQVQKLVNT